MTFLQWLSDNIARFLTISGCAFVVYLLMVDTISHPQTNRNEHPASFFTLQELMSNVAYRGFSIIFAGSVTLVFVALAFRSGSMLTVIKDLLAGRISGGQSTTQDFDKLLNSLPDWADPLLVLSFFLVFFSTKMRWIVLAVRDMWTGWAGISRIVEEKALSASRDLIEMQGRSIPQARKHLLNTYGEVPLPESYVGKKDDIFRMSYQLIWLSIQNIQSNGPAAAFNELRAKLGLLTTEEEHPHVNVVHIAASSFLFFVMMAFYIIVVPMLGGPAKHMGWEWPDPTGAGWSTLILFILCSTLTVVIPLLIGIGMYPMRRRAYAGIESPLSSLVVVAFAQFLVAFGVQEIFNIIDVSFAQANNQTSYTFFMARIHVSAFLYALAPLLAFFLMTQWGPRIAAFGSLTAIVCAVVAIHFFICDAIYEYYCPAWHRLFYHQALLGLWIMFAFFSAASINWRIGNLARESFAIP